MERWEVPRVARNVGRYLDGNGRSSTLHMQIPGKVLLWLPLVFFAVL